MGDVEAAVGQRLVIAGPHQQVLAALAAIRPGQAEVGHPAEPHVVDRSQDRARRRHHRNVDHHRPVREIDERPEVDRVRVRRQEQRRRIHQLGEDQDLVVLDPDAEEPTPDRDQRRPPDAVQVRLDAAHEIEVVVQPLRRLRRRRPVAELKRPEPALHRVRRRDRGRHTLGRAHSRISPFSREARQVRAGLGHGRCTGHPIASPTRDETHRRSRSEGTLLDDQAAQVALPSSSTRDAKRVRSRAADSAGALRSPFESARHFSGAVDALAVRSGAVKARPNPFARVCRLGKELIAMGAAQASAGRQRSRTAVNFAMGALTHIVGCSPPRASCWCWSSSPVRSPILRRRCSAPSSSPRPSASSSPPRGAGSGPRTASSSRPPGRPQPSSPSMCSRRSSSPPGSRSSTWSAGARSPAVLGWAERLGRRWADVSPSIAARGSSPASWCTGSMIASSSPIRATSRLGYAQRSAVHPHPHRPRPQRRTHHAHRERETRRPRRPQRGPRVQRGHAAGGPHEDNRRRTGSPTPGPPLASAATTSTHRQGSGQRIAPPG